MNMSRTHYQPALRAPVDISSEKGTDDRVKATGFWSTREVWVRRLFLAAALSSIVVMALMVIFLFKEGLAIFNTVSLWDFLFGRSWYPTYDPPDFGIGPLIVGSMSVTVLASLMAVPLGLASALYLSSVAGG